MEWKRKNMCEKMHGCGLKVWMVRTCGKNTMGVKIYTNDMTKRVTDNRTKCMIGNKLKKLTSLK